jgi:UDP-N-acetylmuramyl pentapeptide phosphotransferase/UDP-N-acetylglucosamine-1-phosphate transferase
MESAAIAATVFGVALASSLLLTRQATLLGPRLGMMDQPGPRRVHATPVARTGGLAIFLAFVIGLCASFMLDVRRFSAETERLLLLLGAGAVIVVVMAVDDAVGIAPLPKLGWQFLAAGLVVLPRLQGRNHGISIDSFNTPVFGQVDVPLGLAMGLTLFWIVGMMNTMNWVDGLDGLAGSVALVMCGVLFAHTYFWPRGDPQFTISLLPLAIGGAVAGFLWFNWHPARVIMGDAGANFLGLALAVAAVIGGAKIATALLAMGLPILDVAWVIVYRLTHGRSPLEADRGHLHHRLLDDGWSQRQIVLFVAGVSVLFGASALLLPSRSLKLVAMLALGAVLLGLTGALAARGRARSQSLPPETAAPGT